MDLIPISPLSSHASPPSDEEVREVLSSNFAVATKQYQDKPALAERDSHQASETSWSVVSATAGLHSKSPPKEPSGYLLFKQARDAHRAKSCLSPPSSGGLQPPSYKPTATAIHDVDYIQPGLPQPRPKAPPLSLRRQTLEKRSSRSPYPDTSVHSASDTKDKSCEIHTSTDSTSAAGIPKGTSLQSQDRSRRQMDQTPTLAPRLKPLGPDSHRDLASRRNT